jgi:myo-inositol 2-dehydrogenase/D-chiro-inositol 1-dehydrogenase
MAITVAECDAMIGAAAHHGVRLMVGHVLRLLPLFSRLIDVVESGLLGRPVAVQILRLSWLGDPAARYRLRRETTGGQLYDITVHEIDLLHRLCGPITSVYATMSRTILQDIDYEDTVQLHLRFQSGATAHIFESIASPTDRAEGVILATQGTLRFDWRSGQLAYRRAGDAEETVETVTRDSGEDGYLRELRSFTTWVLDGTPPLLTAREGRAAIAVVEAAYRSAQTGQPVDVPSSGE